MNAARVRVVTTICTIVIASCASHPEPIIDMQGVDRRALEIDRAECEAYADEVIVARGAAKGAAGGAVAGAAAGAIGGNAERGAGYGAVWGATRSTVDGAREKQQVFKRCLRGRGYRVLN